MPQKAPRSTHFTDIVLHHHGAELEETAQTVGEQCLEYLSVLKKEKPGSGTIASAGNSLQKSIRSLGRLAGVSLPLSLCGLWPQHSGCHFVVQSSVHMHCKIYGSWVSLCVFCSTSHFFNKQPAIYNRMYYLYLCYNEHVRPSDCVFAAGPGE